MTTTNLSQINGTEYTWNTVSLTWGDPVCELRNYVSFSDVISYDLDVGEDVIVSDGKSLASTKPIAETVGFADGKTNAIGKRPSETLAFSEDRTSDVGQAIAETLGIAEAQSKTAGKKLTGSVNFAESVAKSFGLNISRALGFVEAFSRTAAFSRNFAEGFFVAESVAKTYALKLNETLTVFNVLRRAGDLVISDMMMSAVEDMTMSDFERFLSYGNVPGYHAWRDFIPGDYEYREAMVRVVLESKNSDRGLLTGMQMAVDVPDVIDRGTATITDAANGLEVEYNRPFHIVPEITLAARGGVGNPTIPEFYGTPSTTSFRVRLRDSVTGLFVTGKFTWAAHGY